MWQWPRDRVIILALVLFLLSKSCQTANSLMGGRENIGTILSLRTGSFTAELGVVVVCGFQSGKERKA